MPHEITMEGDLIKVRLYGSLTNAGLGELAGGMARLEATSPVALHRLIDLRGSDTVNLDFPSLFAVGKTRTAAPLANPVKSALIAPDQILYGFARMFQALNANPSITVAIFPSEQSARAWLREPGVAPPPTPWAPGSPAQP